MTCTRLFLLASALSVAATAGAGVEPPGWRPLFDGRSLAGWKASENPASFRVEDGAIACDGPRAHLFYVGSGADAPAFEDFELSLEVMTRPGANSGVYFHTAYQEKDWPAQGFEVQVNNSQPRQGDYLEHKMTGSLYGIRNLYRPVVRDDEWFTMNVLVRRPLVQVRLNGTLVVDYREPGSLPAGAPAPRRLGRGTFALQCHDPASRVFYRNLRARPAPPLPAAEAPPLPVVDPAYLQVLELSRANFPTLDLHAHLKGGLTLEQALALSRRTGMGLGLAVNCGKGFPIQTDADALAFVESMKGQPVFVGMQAEGREWVSMFSSQTRARFDYVFTDSMTWTSPAGQRMRLWIPEEVEIGPDPQAFMELLVDKTVGILRDEPIDVYVNPTFLPAAIADRYQELWSEARMKRVIEAAVASGVAIEINARYKLPSEAFLRLAKAAGAKFTFGTNNAGASDLGDWSYPLEMQRRLGLTWKDMFVPGHQPSRAQRELRQRRSGSPLDALPASVEQLTQFGERADFSPDDRRVAFMAKSFGDAFVIDLATRAVRCLTCGVPGAAFLRVMHLSSGDYLLIGPERFEDLRRSRSRDNELWFLSARPGSRPVRLGQRMSEGAAVSKTAPRIAFSVSRAQDESLPEAATELVVADLDLTGPQPRLVNRRAVHRSPGPECFLEAQDFLDADRRLTYSCYEPGDRASVWTLDLGSGERVNHSAAIGFYNEVEGVFPDGRHACVESDHQSREYGDGPSFRNIDVWKLRLDGSGRSFTRLTHFNDHQGWKASNPVVSRDGRLMAFQVGRTADEAGVGYGILLMRLDGRAPHPAATRR